VACVNEEKGCMIGDGGEVWGKETTCKS